MERTRRAVWLDLVRRVLNGPCAGGHGGQVIGKENSQGPKARFVLLRFSKRKRSTYKLFWVIYRVSACIYNRIRDAVAPEAEDYHSQRLGYTLNDLL